MNVYGQLKKAIIENTVNDFANTIKGFFWFNTTSNKVKWYDGTAVRTAVDTDTAQSLSQKTLASPTINAPTITLPQIDISTLSMQVTPATPAAGNVKIYAKNTKQLYVLDETGQEKALGSGGGGSALLWEKTGIISPLSEYIDGFHFETFFETEDAEIYAFLNVPSDYSPGTQIKLLGGSFFCSSTSGQAYFKAETTLLKRGSSVLGSYPDKYISTNAISTVAVISNQLTAIPTIDLTDATGKINSVSVAGGDKLRVRLLRASSGESSSAQNGVKVLINNFEPKFTA